jgi:hypothetical protein
MHASLSHIALIEALANRMGPYMPPTKNKLIIAKAKAVYSTRTTTGITPLLSGL